MIEDHSGERDQSNEVDLVQVPVLLGGLGRRLRRALLGDVACFFSDMCNAVRSSI
ncbi:hypothetical protein ACFOJ6_15610 [Gordonia humi]|uniref:hypothetical protein n=1 Tax=Gordonia humi TaxID=686429 RepID=UPI0036156C56